MVERGGSQCGYCTPGFVMSLFCEYYRPGRNEPDPEAIGGNLCRCTGYRPILDVLAALPAVAPNDSKRPQLRLPLLAKLDTAESEYTAGSRRFLRPRTLEQVFEVLERWPQATLIAGGTDLMVTANQRYERYDVMVSLEHLDELRRFELFPNEFVFGAGLTLTEIEARLRDTPKELALFEQLLPLFSSRLIRNRATLGGNLGTASPIGDFPPGLLALDAEVSLASRAGTRRMPLAQFFVDYRRTARAENELISAIHVPRPTPQLQRFYKVSKRVLDDISIVSAAFALDVDADGKVSRFRAAFGGVAATPVRALEVEPLAEGQPWTRDTFELLAKALIGLGTPISDHRGSAEYRALLPRKLLERFFVETAERAEAAE
jgi:xanthine dehydrogenase small subunit